MILVWICVVADFINECGWPHAILNVCVDFELLAAARCSSTARHRKWCAQQRTWAAGHPQSVGPPVEFGSPSCKSAERNYRNHLEDISIKLRNTQV